MKQEKNFEIVSQTVSSKLQHTGQWVECSTQCQVLVYLQCSPFLPSLGDSLKETPPNIRNSTIKWLMFAHRHLSYPKRYPITNDKSANLGNNVSSGICDVAIATVHSEKTV